MSRNGSVPLTPASTGVCLTTGSTSAAISTTMALAILARRTGAPVLPVFALPSKPGRFRMVFEHPVEPPADDTPEAILDFTQRCTDVLEMYVRRHPDLWLWMHRRWRDDEDAAGRVGS